jgi:5-methylcytosine-specific restriction protein A
MPIRPAVHKPPGAQSRKRWFHPSGKETAASRGYGKDWSIIRGRVLVEEPLCRYCLAEGKATPSTTVDHMRPKSDGGSNARTNLCGCCDRHQKIKASREGIEARREAESHIKVR